MVTAELQPVFISFATDDEDIVRHKIYLPLTNAGFEAFMYTQARDGGVIVPKIQDALDRAGSLVFALSEHSADPEREWLASELDAFQFTHKRGAVTVVNVGTIAPRPLLESLMQLRGHDVLEADGWFEQARARLEQPPERKPNQGTKPPSLPEWVAQTWAQVGKIADLLPRELFTYPDSVVEKLKSKLESAGVVILRGSQLSGKSKLLWQLAGQFPRRLEVKSIRPQDIEEGLRKLFDAAYQTSAPASEFLLPLAAWASHAARSVLDQLETDERDRVGTSPGGPYLAKYADSRQVALDDIQHELQRTGDGKGGPNQILAFQRSLTHSLQPVLDYASGVETVLLPILIEDFHEYAKLSESVQGPAVRTPDLQSFAERFLRQIDYLATAQMQSNREPQRVYIIVTTRAVASPSYQATSAYEDLEELTSSIRPKDVASALSSELTSWSEDDISALLDAGMQAVSGHAYFLNRFLRAATALRSANTGRSVGEIVAAVESLQQIWYQDRLSETKTSHASSRSPGHPTPNIHPAEYTPFLASVARLASEEPQLLAEYRKILESRGGRRGDTAYDKAYLIPLLQLGLIKADPEKGGYVPSCRIVERFFSPTSLEALLSLRS